MKTLHIALIQILGTLFLTALFIGYDKLIADTTQTQQLLFIFVCLGLNLLVSQQAIQKSLVNHSSE